MCGWVSGFRHDTMWFDKDDNVHDFNMWQCQHCGKIFKLGEDEEGNWMYYKEN